MFNGMIWFFKVALQGQEEGEVPLPGQEPQTIEVPFTITEVLVLFKPLNMFIVVLLLELLN